jgi:hypothetical protein
MKLVAQKRYNYSCHRFTDLQIKLDAGASVESLQKEYALEFELTLNHCRNEILKSQILAFRLSEAALVSRLSSKEQEVHALQAEVCFDSALLFRFLFA